MLIRKQNRIGIAALAVGIALCAQLCNQPVFAQDQDSPQQFITVHSGGLDGLIVSPKDAGLKNALRMLDERVVELPAEVNDPSMPGPMLGMVVDLLMRPNSAKVALIPGFAELDLNQIEAPPFIGQIDFYTATADEAGELAGTLHQLISQAMPAPAAADPEYAGLYMMDADGATLRYGAGTVGGQNALTLSLNGYSTDVARINLTGLPQGVQPAFAMDLDTGAIMPLIEAAMEQAPPDERAMIEMQLQMYGMTTDQPFRMIAAAGYAADRSHGLLRIVNGRAMAEQMHSLADGPLTADDMRLIPVDATMAEAGKFNPAYFTNLVEQVRQQLPPEMEGQDPFEMFQQQTGIDLQRDIIDNIGQTYWTYTADATGGGLLGYVSIVELSDAAGMQDTLDNITQMANQMAHGPAKGYVRFMSREIGGHNMTVLTFPGLPVPLEISFAIFGDKLFGAMTPQALLGAVAQAATPRQSVLENPRFREMGGMVPDGAMQVTFVDTPRLAASGYGLVSMGMSALANAVRSPQDAAREPGVLMPSLAEMLEGAKATVYVTSVQGDDIVMVSQGDRSAIVNLCGAAGAMGGASGAAMIGALGAGVMLPAIGEARMQAKATMSMAQLRNIATAAHIYASEFDDQIPESLDVLLEVDLLFSEILDSPFDEDRGGVDFGYHGGGRFADIRFPDRRILAWDRVMLDMESTVNVAFADGHVESLMQHELQNLLAHPANEGLDLYEH